MGRSQRISTGVTGLDQVLAGGLPAVRTYLIEGTPGTGKTTLAVQTLLAGAALGESVLYVTLSETREELEAVARSHGWDLSGITLYEMSTGGVGLEEENTLYLPSEVELGEHIRMLLEEVDRVHPTRLVIDSCSELRLLAQTPLRFRRQLMALKRELVGRGCTVFLIENAPAGAGDVLLQSLVHGVIRLDQTAPLFGTTRRRLSVQKLREVSFRGGYHDFIIDRGGLVVHPRLVAAEHHRDFEPGQASSGLAGLDELTGGGLERGTSTLLMGPAGTGKSAVAMQYAVAAAARGEAVSLFNFDESLSTVRLRSGALGMDIEAYEEQGLVTIRRVDPAELSPGEFTHAVREEVEERGARLVILDSLNGYIHAMPDEHFVMLQLHELLTYLRQQGVVSLVVVAQHGLTNNVTSPLDLSYLTDAVFVLRYFEVCGQIRKAISVLKNRSGPHERTIREFILGPTGMNIGPPLERFRGLLQGTPVYEGGVGEDSPLMESGGDE